MASGNKKKLRRRDRLNGKEFYPLLSDESIINAEKHKARKLRNTAWWRKKISRGLCHYCGGKFEVSQLTMDHKIPLSKGGTSEKFNLVPACKSCNNKKKNLLPVEWDEYIESIKNS